MGCNPILSYFNKKSNTFNALFGKMIFRQFKRKFKKVELSLKFVFVFFTYKNQIKIIIRSKKWNLL